MGVMKMYDVECPYCGAKEEINHDDGYGYKEDEVYEQECGECEKTFVFTTSISFYYEVEQAPCKNGGGHDWKQMTGFPKEAFIGMFRCACCDEEESREPEKRQAALDAYMKKLMEKE